MKDVKARNEPLQLAFKDLEKFIPAMRKAKADFNLKGNELEAGTAGVMLGMQFSSKAS